MTPTPQQTAQPPCAALYSPHNGITQAQALGLSDVAAQCNLQQFMASLWLHFFRQRSNGDIDWKECPRRRRKHVCEATGPEINEFIAFMALHAPENHKEQLVAAVKARVADTSLNSP